MNANHRYLKALTVAVAVLITATACSTSGSGDAGAGADDCQPKYEFPTVAAGKLTIVTYDLPPLYTGTGSAAEGIDKDILDRLAEEACLEPVWNVLPAASVIESVRSGRADIAGGAWSANEERGEILNQSDAPYVELPTLIAKTEISDINDLKDKTVGTITGYLWVEDAQAFFGDDLKLYPSDDAVLEDIEAGRIDAGLTGGFNGYAIKTKGLDLVATIMEPDPAITASVEKTRPNYPHTKGNDELTDALNAALKEMRDDGFIVASLEKFGLSATQADISVYDE